MSDAPAVYGYHAHVYYDAATLPVAEKLKAELGARFDVELGPNSGERVGPHPVPQFQVIFRNEQFQTVVPWLMLNRESLDILIHPLTPMSEVKGRGSDLAFRLTAGRFLVMVIGCTGSEMER